MESTFIEVFVRAANGRTLQEKWSTLKAICYARHVWVYIVNTAEGTSVTMSVPVTVRMVMSE